MTAQRLQGAHGQLLNQEHCRRPAAEVARRWRRAGAFALRSAPMPAPSPMPPTLTRPADGAPWRVLMVCMGNICRSPTAHGVLHQRVGDAGLAACVQVDSAGTHGHHVGAPPDRRAQAHALRRGYDLSAQRARQLTRRDFADFDLVLVMDGQNERAARALCPPAQAHKLHRLTDFCTRHAAREVPDPYYGGDAGFEAVLDLVEDACTGLLSALR
jgi:protein-tyrosine phosphatase